jgi:DNA-binding NarL/FixJ family response regulator
MGISLLIVDDHSLVRDGIKSLLQDFPIIDTIEEADNGNAAIIKASVMKPDVILMDYEMPKSDGLYATRQILKDNSDAKVLMVSMHMNQEVIISALEAGVMGFISKDAKANELIHAIKSVYDGEKYFKGKIMEMITPYLINSRKGNKQKVDRKNQLTKREMEITKLIAEGYSPHVIAEKLFISIRTIEVHKTNVFHKLNINSTAELIRWAIKNKIIVI